MSKSNASFFLIKKLFYISKNTIFPFLSRTANFFFNEKRIKKKKKISVSSECRRTFITEVSVIYQEISVNISKYERFYR